MKKTFLLFMIIMIVGCVQKEEEIELIRPTNENYIFIQKLYSRDGRLITKIYDISDNQVVKVSKAVEGIKVILLKSERNLEVTKIPQGVAFTPNQFLYTLYINELGKIDKVVVINSPSKDADTYLVGQMKDWQMEIFKSNDDTFKYTINWEFGFFKPKGENKLSLLNSNLKVSENIEAEKRATEDEYFVAVEEMPEPIGGIKAIQEKIIYPEIAKRAGIEGRVYVKAFIDENGNVAEAKVIKGIGAGCDEAAISAVVNTKFKPGRQRGEAVKVQVSIPILFKLSDDKFKGSSKILGKWEGKSNKGEEIKISFYNDGSTNLYKSQSGIMDGKRTGATFWPDYRVDSSSIPYKLDLNIKEHNFSKALLKFITVDSIIISRSFNKNIRPQNFNSENISEIWELKRVK